ncbi:MAG TPA: PspC domain-containing protein [Thermoleophilia bacterium]|nr:PspC domain-containing protein [Thermoleophilia bacterium]
MGKRLARSRDEKMVCGVAAGLARYFDLDPTIMRLIWVVAVLLPGPNLIIVAVYLVLCLLMPLETPGGTA